MTRYYREVAISGSVEDILGRLQEENRMVAPYLHSSDSSGGRSQHLDFFSRREGNSFIIYGQQHQTPVGVLHQEHEDHPSVSDVIRFDVSQITDGRSLVRGAYEQDNVEVKRMFLTRLARLGIEFGEDWGREVNQELTELELRIRAETGVHWGYTDWRTDKKTGLRTRIYGAIRNDPSRDRTAGRQKLSLSNPDEHVYRLAKAQEALEVYEAGRGSHRTWSDVCKQILWRYGADKSAVKLLYLARQELKWLRQTNDPDGWLEKVKEFREKEKKEID
jgi:hypothetical protein